MSLIVNIMSGPGAGKSSTAAWLFSELKFRNKDVELVQEFCKNWAYQKRPITKYDQLFITFSQLHKEYELINAGVDNIITDSPVILGYIYALKNGYEDMAFQMLNLIEEYYDENETVNIFLNRKDKKYIQKGRNENKEQAGKVDELIKQTLEDNILNMNEGENLFFVDFDKKEEILDIVLKKIK